MKDRAYPVLGLALLVALGLLMRISPGGGRALGAAAVVLVLAALTTPAARARRRGLAMDLGAVLGPALAATVAVLGLLELGLAMSPPPALAWFARALCLTAAVLLFHTPAQALVLHGLVVVLALWTASALRGALDPGVGLVVVIAVAVTSYGLLLARSCEQRSVADGALAVGVAPTPWGLRRPWLPVLGVVVLTLVPFALGARLPRPGGSPAAGAAIDGAATNRAEIPFETRRGAHLPPADRRVAFTTELRLDLGHRGLEQPDERVALARADPAPDVLYLRGAALTLATEAGFRTPRDRLPEPRPAESTQELALTIQLLRREKGYLFAQGRPLSFDVPTQTIPGGVLADPEASYPLRYEVRCALPDPAKLVIRDLIPLRAPELLDLPRSIRDDPDLRALTDRIAWRPSAHLRATAVMRWLMTNARYDARQPVPGGDMHEAMRAFLLGSRRGICVEFATAAAVLLRLADVPSRVVTGYRTRERDGDVFVVRGRHAHAWVEVAFEGAGWLPYDPTPGVVAAPPPVLSPPPTPSTPSTPAPSRLETLPAGWPLWALPTSVLALACVALALWIASALRLRQAVRLAQLDRGAASTSLALAGDRARFFGLLAARGFDLEGAKTPAEWLANRGAILPSEPGLSESIAHYTYLRFSGKGSPDRLDALRRSLRCLKKRPAATPRRSSS